MNRGVPFIVEQVRDRTQEPGWRPVIGQELCDFLNAVPEPSRGCVRDDAVGVLARGAVPTESEEQRTGLVTGYVQSGKTMSFESVAALARDNQFPMVIVIAGMANNLLDQSAGRLRRDLGMDELSRERRWVHLNNPGTDDSTIQTVRDVMADWRDPDTPIAAKRTVLITVLKHHAHLRNLADLLASVQMAGAPVLVIDDEADQASLNNDVAQGEESSTYRRLMGLRSSLPNHTYLQYTATPQAPLLISIADALSPDFVQVLEPGPEYVGGLEFFADDSTLVEAIPDHEVPTTSNPLTEPPCSLLEALRVFMVGVACGLVDGGSGNRSMLVHPSHRTAQHREYYDWVRDVTEEWKRVLDLAEDDADKQELVEDFRTTYEDLARTLPPDAPTFEAAISALRRAFRSTRVLEVNAVSGTTPAVDWSSAYAWILVGGQAMDRGFTVEGLTVTYMPRGIGTGNADTVQQRARFFGYKRPYLGYCRVYLQDSTLHAFRSYVEHEEDIRRQLKAVQQSTRPLAQWKRAFVLDPRLQPCRQHVLEFDYMRGLFSDDWCAPRVVLAPMDVIESNREAVEDFIRGLAFSDDPGNPARTITQSHLVASGVPLKSLLEQLLLRIRIPGARDSQLGTGLLLQLSRALDSDPDEPSSVFIMSRGTRRRRGVDEDGVVPNLFQGADPVNPPERRGEVYPGDRSIRNSDQATVQIHRLDLTQEGQVVAEDVPVVAVWVPARLARPWVVQDQPTQATTS